VRAITGISPFLGAVMWNLAVELIAAGRDEGTPYYNAAGALCDAFRRQADREEESQTCT